MFGGEAMDEFYVFREEVHAMRSLELPFFFGISNRLKKVCGVQ